MFLEDLHTWLVKGTTTFTLKCDIEFSYEEKRFLVDSSSTRAAILRGLHTKLNLRNLTIVHFELDDFVEGILKICVIPSKFLLLTSSCFENVCETNFVTRNTFEEIEQYFYNFYEQYDFINNPQKIQTLQDFHLKTYDSLPMTYVLLKTRDQPTFLQFSSASIATEASASAAPAPSVTHMGADSFKSSVST